MKDREIVPLHEAKVPIKNGPWRTKTTDLPNGRSIRVGFSEEGFIGVWIWRDTEDGKRSKLDFGLSNDAAQALCVLLLDALDAADDATGKGDAE